MFKVSILSRSLNFKKEKHMLCCRLLVNTCEWATMNEVDSQWEEVDLTERLTLMAETK